MILWWYIFQRIIFKKIYCFAKDGVFGSLIIREAKDVHAKLYDFDLKEHVVMLNEWTAQPFETIYAPFLHDALYLTVNSILINGKGQVNNGNTSMLVPLEIFYVEKAYRYRFRLMLNGIQHCPIEFSIEQHNLTVIASDGNPIEPYVVQSIGISAGIHLLNGCNAIIRATWGKAHSCRWEKVIIT